MFPNFFVIFLNNLAPSLGGIGGRAVDLRIRSNVFFKSIFFVKGHVFVGPFD